MALDFRTLLGVVFDSTQAQSELNKQIKSLQKNSKLALDIKLTDAQAKKSIQDQIKMWSNYRKEAVSSISAPNTELQKMAQYYKSLEKEIQSQISTRSKLAKAESEAYQMNQKFSDSMEIVKTKAQASSKTFDNYINSLNKNKISSYSNEINNVSKAFEKAIETGNRTDYSKATSSMQNLKSQLKGIGAETQSFTQILGDDISKFAQWTISATALMSAINSVKNVVSTVYNLDSSLTDLRQATGLSADEAKELLNTYIDLGKELGATGSEVASSADQWLRQGKSVSETNTLIKDSMVLAKDGQLDSAGATSYLTSAMKGYKVAVNDVIGIVDKLTKVDMSSATSAGGLAEAMSQTANNANMAGISMDKLIGYLAVVGETTGESMSSVGNSFSTIFSRMANIKLKNLANPETKSDINNVETSLKNVGIELREDESNFRNFGDVLDDVSNKWAGMSEVNQRAIAVSIAGKDHMEDFLVLMNNYAKATEYSTSAQDSAGTAMDKFSIYTESAQAKTKKLQANLESLAENTLNSDLIKGFLDASSMLVKFADSTDLVQIALLTLATVGMTKAVPALSSLMASGVGYVSTLGTMIAEEIVATGSTGTLTGAMTALNVVMDTNPMLALVAGVAALVGAVKGVVAIYDKFNVSVKEHEEALQKAQAAYEESKTTLSELNDELKTTQQRIDELTGKDKLTFTEKSELDTLKESNKELQLQLELQKEINSQKAQKVADETVDTFKAKYGDVSQSAVNTYIASANATGNNAILTSDKNDLSALMAGYKEFEKLKEEALSSGNAEDVNRYKDILNDIKTQLTSGLTDLQNYKKALSSVPFDELDSDGQKAFNDINSAIGLVWKTIDEQKWNDIQFSSVFDDSTFADVKNKLVELSKAGELSEQTLYSNNEYQQLMSKTGLTAGQVVDQIKALTSANETNSSSANVNTESTTEQSKSLYTLAEAAENATGYVNELGENVDISNLTQSLNDAKTQYQDFATMLKELNSKSGKLSSDSTNSIITKYPQLLSYLNDESALRKKIQGDMEDQKTTALDYYKQIMELDGDYYVQTVNNHAKLFNKIKEYYGVDYSNFKSLAEAKYETDVELLTKLQAAWKAYVDQLEAIDKIQNSTYKSTVNNSLLNARDSQFSKEASSDLADKVKNSDKTKQLKKDFETQQKLYNQVKKTLTVPKSSLDLSNIDFDGSKEKAEKDAKDKSKDQKETVDWIDRALSVISTKYNAVKKLATDVYSTFKNQNSEIDKANKLLEQQISVESKSYDVYMKKANSVGLSDSLKKKVQNGSIQISDYSSGTADKIKQYQDWYDKAQEVKDKITELRLEEKELAKQKIDNITDDYDKKLNYYDSKISQRESSISLKEDKGGTASKSDFDYIIKQSKTESTLLSAEYKKVNDEFQKLIKNGTIKKGSDDWYDYSDKLSKIKDKMDDVTKATIDAQNNIQKLKWDKFDDGIDNIDNNLSEIDQLVKLTDEGSNERNLLLQTGFSQAKEKSAELRDEISKLNKEYAKDKNNTTYKERLSELNSELYSAVDAMQSYNDALVESVKVRYDDQIDSLNKERDAWEELINAQKEALTQEKENHDYQKTLAEKTKKVSDTESRIAELDKAAKSGDRKAIEEKKDLEDQLAEYKDDLSEEQYDHSIDLQQDELDKSLDAYNKANQAKIDAINALYDKETELISKAANLTTSEFKKAFDDIVAYATANNLTVSANLQNALTGVNNSNSGYSDFTSSLASSVKNNKILDILKNGQGASNSNSELNKYIMSKGYKPISYAQMATLASILGVSGIDTVDDVKNDANKNKILSALKAAGFSTGGLVKATGEDGIALVKNDEFILNQQGSKIYREDLVPLMNNFVKNFTAIPNSLQNVTTNNNSAPIFNITIPITGNADSTTVTALKSTTKDMFTTLYNEMRKS